MNKFVSSVFGKNSELTNEPTIDYNQTIYNTTKYETKDTRHDESSRYNDLFENIPVSTPGNLDIPVGTQELNRQLKHSIQVLNNQNDFLKDLNDLVDENDKKEDGDDKKEDKNDFEAKYNQLRKDFIEEISNHHAFYKSYQSLLLKYKQLKTSQDSNVDDKINKIKSITTDPSIKNLCDELLLDCNQKDLLINSYKLELDAANLKISHLEIKK
ncbi:hypothetical protein HYPBUDRAFT_164100 [Hyphopichia burtonii NRRL Y-1933]|uniref:Uncharacterized protein n=1 Tax=Hyphopichia burtonii NRRL Y-1933 TaxID=984485 RepID=A0A1E4RQA9_9ASCO|nr:hypothetical protein HYPBUDRAFT_164100 [Hyphopichia burtonii NRRL Y-1933]ODV69474.1 hypothetical protein HYPBUDRAFT_164100 [Hyphopichia burtonii NRRL Y-1933]